MTHVSLSSDVLRPLPFYLALEEYVARTMPAGDYFLLWQVTPTVIFGRNQQRMKWMPTTAVGTA